jgi:hypothetical protein
MQIDKIQGLAQAQIATLQALGAIVMTDRIVDRVTKN